MVPTADIGALKTEVCAIAGIFHPLSVDNSAVVESHAGRSNPWARKLEVTPLYGRRTGSPGDPVVKATPKYPLHMGLDY